MQQREHKGSVHDEYKLLAISGAIKLECKRYHKPKVVGQYAEPETMRGKYPKHQG